MPVRAEVFRGDLGECLRHFAAAFNRKYPRGLKGAEAARKPLADFCGILASTANRWFTGGNLPVGVQQFKLCVFLEIQGYHVTELGRLEEANRGYFDLIAYGVITPEELVKKLNYSHTTDVYSLIRGQIKSQDKLELMWEIYKSHKDKLEALREEAKSKYFISLKAEGGNKQLAPIAGRSAQALQQASGVLEILSGLNKLLRGRPFNGLTVEDLKEMDPNAVPNILEVTTQLGEIGQLILAEQSQE